MIDNREVGRRIARLRQERGLTQMQLAAMMNVSHQAVSKWESGAAMPDIQTLLELTRFFGLTVEQMTGADLQEEPMAAQEDEESTVDQPIDGQAEPDGEQAPGMDDSDDSEEKVETEVKCTMNLKQLLQMAPFMSKEAVAEVALRLDGQLSADDIAKLAPFLPQEGMEELLEKHHPGLTWDTLRKLAPFMRRETVDKLVRSIADGEQKVSGSTDGFDRTMDGLGRAFNGLGRGVDKAVRQALRIGESIVNEVGSALNNLGKDVKDAEVKDDDGAEAATTDRTKELRRRAFERALEDGRWDWLAEHVDELEDGDELKERIAKRAQELGMTDWLELNMGESAAGTAAEAALLNGDLEWLGQHIDELSTEQQFKALHLAVQEQNWSWLEDAADDIEFDAQIGDIVREVWRGGNGALAVQLAEENFDDVSQYDELFREAVDAGDREVTDLLWENVSPDCAGAQLLRLAGQGDWAQVEAQLKYANRECLEGLMELAVDQGNFDAVDFLNDKL